MSEFKLVAETVNFEGRSFKVFHLFKAGEEVRWFRSQSQAAEVAFDMGASLGNTSWRNCKAEKAVIQRAIEAGKDPRKPGTPLSLFARTLAGLEHDEKAKEAAPCEQ